MRMRLGGLGRGDEEKKKGRERSGVGVISGAFFKLKDLGEHTL